MGMLSRSCSRSDVVGGQSLLIFEDNPWEPPHLALLFGSEGKHAGKALELHLAKAEDLVEECFESGGYF